jgi:type I restriction enzyme S subunit
VKLPAYPKYKPSGVEWLGDVPEHWDVKRISLLASREARSFTDGDWIESPYITDEGMRLLQTGNVGIGAYREQGYRYVTEQTFRELRCSEVRPNDVLICRLAAPVGRACLAPDLGCKMITSVDVCILRPAPEVDPRFVVYFFSSKDYLDWLDGLCRGSTRDRISRSMLGALRSILPPLAEQRAIAAFLDRETGRVDRLVAKKRELIERLKEKRTALISRTVTRGLPPAAARAAGLPTNPPLKLSGVEWLGEIPKHWEVAQLRRKAHILDCKHRTVPFIDDGIPLASIREVHGFKVDLTNAKQTSEEEYLNLIEGDRRPRVGDIIYSRNATVGDAALVTTKERFCMGQDVCLIRAPKHHAKFLLYLFRSPLLMEQVESLMIGSTFRRINVGQIHAFWICVPPHPEQAAIAAYLDEETAKLDALVGKVEEAVERLQEYRTALITAAVTGKIDVRSFSQPGRGSTSTRRPATVSV